MIESLKQKITSHKRVVLGALLILTVGIGASIAWYATQVPHKIDGAYHIVLKNDGFHPKNLVIKEGDTVVFSTENDKPFWPASNVHPTHTAYPDFDPKKPVAQNETWQFTFPKAGTYGFHDHIVSTFDGEIIVEKSDGSRVVVDCTVEKTAQCWEKLIFDTLDHEGVEAAFNKILSLSENEPLFQNDCHGLSHLIGERAYKLYVAKDNFEITPATALCGYGFYHGFMETMLLTTGNIEEAREFCEFADKKLAGQASDASTACYHGTGHGAIDGSDPTAWGDIDAMMAPGFKLCDMLAQNTLQLYLCDTGVFNAIEILSMDPKYGITFLQKDPFSMCNKQPVERREGCYSNMLPIILNMTNNDIAKSADYINKNMIDKEVIAIDGHTVNELTTLGLMFEYIRLYGQEPDYAEKGIAFCRAQPEDDRIACIKGLSGGHIKYGKPGVEYLKNIEFCENTLLTSEEKDACYQYTLQRISGRYDPQTTEKICTLVGEEYKNKYCQFLNQ